MAFQSALAELRSSLGSGNLEISDDIRDSRFAHLIKNRLIKSCEPLLQKELAQNPNLSAGDIVERLKKSEEFQEEKEKLLSECSQAVNQLGPVNQTQSVDISSPTKAELRSMSVFSSEGRFSLAGDSSMAQSSMLFLSRNSLSRAVTVLSQLDAQAETKHEALQQLMKMPSAEIGHQPEWQSLREVLGDLVLDSEVCSEALKLLVKMFNAPNPVVVVETVLAITSMVKSGSTRANKVKKLTWGDRREENEQTQTICHLRTFRIWLKMLLTLPRVWIRYPEHQISQVVSDVLEIFEIDSDPHSIYSGKDAFVCMAVLDPKLSWFRSWIHPRHSRQHMTHCWSKSRKFLERILLAAFNDGKTFSSPDSDPAFLRYSKSDVNHLLWSYLLKSGLILLQYEDVCMELFPFDMTSHEMTVSSGDLFVFLLQVWFDQDFSDDPNYGYLHDCILRVSRSRSFNQLFLQSPVLMQIRKLLNDKSCPSGIKTTILEIVNKALLTTPGIITNETTANKSFWKYISEFCITLIQEISKDDGFSYQQGLVLANVRLCQTLCRRLSTRGFIDGDRYLTYLSRLVQEDVCDLENLLWFLTIFGTYNQSLKRFRRNFLTSDVTGWLLCPLKVGPTLIDCFMKQMEQLLSVSPAVNLPNTALTVSPDEIFVGAVPLRPLVFSLICHPGADVLCMGDQRFVDFVDKSLNNLHQSDNYSIGLSILSLLTINLDWIFAMENNVHLSSKIEQFFGDEPRHMITQEMVLLSQLYLRLTVIAGPKEHSDPMSTWPVNVHQYFVAEPSRFLIKQVNITANDLPSDLLLLLLDTLESRQRPPYAAIISRFAADIESGSLSRTDFSAEKRKHDWRLMLEYGENLKLFTDATKVCVTAKALNGESLYHPESRKDGMDWFASILFLLLDGDTHQLVPLLKNFSRNFSASTVWPYFSGNFASNIKTQVWPLIEQIIENDFGLKVAFEKARLSPLCLVILWMNQCFLNVLDWPEVCNYVTGCLIGGNRFQSCFCLCLLSHLSCNIKVHSHVGDLAWFLFEPNFKSFKFHNYAPYFKLLYYGCDQ